MHPTPREDERTGKKEESGRRGQTISCPFFLSRPSCYLLLSRKPVSKSSCVIPSMTIVFYFKLCENMQVIWLVWIASTTLILTLSLETENSIRFSPDYVFVIAILSVVKKKQDWWHFTRKCLSEFLREKVYSV